MFILKSILLFFILLLVFGLFSILSLAGVIRSLLAGRNNPSEQSSQRGATSSQAKSQTKQPQQQRKIYSKDEGEYVDFTEV